MVKVKKPQFEPVLPRAAQLGFHFFIHSTCISLIFCSHLINDSPLVKESRKRQKKKKAQHQGDSNPQPPDCDVSALPLHYNQRSWLRWSVVKMAHMAKPLTIDLQADLKAPALFLQLENLAW